jgi:hypothetical protein
MCFGTWNRTVASFCVKALGIRSKEELAWEGHASRIDQVVENMAIKKKKARAVLLALTWAIP